MKNYSDEFCGINKCNVKKIVFQITNMLPKTLINEGWNIGKFCGCCRYCNLNIGFLIIPTYYCLFY